MVFFILGSQVLLAQQPDTDGDGVEDHTDLDDDNDGILDLVEGCENTGISSTIGLGSNVTNTTYNLVGTDITYSLNNPDNIAIFGYDAGLNGHSIRIEANAGDAGSLTTTYSTPISGVQFKLSDFDHSTQYTAEIYDENNILYDLTVEGIVSVGSRITQTGNFFEADSGDTDGNDPADDVFGSILFYFPRQVSRMVLTFNHPVNSSTRFTQPIYCILDTDNDGIADFHDLDSEGDGIPDNVEAQITTGYVAPNADNLATYISNNGVNSAYLGGLSPTNTDAADNPDYLDTDSDNEGGNDSIEAEITLTGNDIDNDGLDDAVDADTSSYADPGGTIDDPLSGTVILLDTDNDAISGGDVDFRDAIDNRVDTDSDGLVDAVDLDDDNDGVPDSNELSFIIGNGQPDCTGETILDFSTAPTLELGTALQEGAIYRFSTITSGVDALVTIERVFNAFVADIDNNSAEPQAFRPRTGFDIVNIGKKGYIEYRIQFVNLGLTTPVVIDKFLMNVNDTDGNIEYSEEIWMHGPSSYIISNPTELTITHDTPWVIGTGGTTEYPGAGNTFPQANFGTTYISKSEIFIRTGISTIVPAVAASGREHNIDFRCTTNYINPENYGIDIDVDGIGNHLDLDSDNDGILDAVEAGHGHPHSNGFVNGSVDNDGIPDVVQASPTSGAINYSIAESTDDTDLSPDFLDLDSDGDGIPDNVEGQTTFSYIAPNVDVATTYASNNGVNSAYLGGVSPTNTDGADNPDYLDTDSDNEGGNDVVEAGIILSGTDVDNDGLDDASDGDLNGFMDPGGTIDNPLALLITLPDIDNDATTGGDVDFRDPTDDFVDLDSDDDGILDSFEDWNTDSDDDPTTNPTDSDNDGIADYLDIDSDDDGIPDNVEAQTTSGYLPPSLVDENNNGLDDAYENGTDLGIIPVNTDGADMPDYLDDDSDGDGVPDNIEAHDHNTDGIADVTYIGSDQDFDGLDDNYEGIEQIDVDVNDEIDDPINDLPNSDGDSESDYRDLDDDNDGVPTMGEDSNGDMDYSNDDWDNDGIPDYLDPDIQSDDELEVFNVITPNGDGIHDVLTIRSIENYPNNDIQVYNRWGILVFETIAYRNQNNNFDGRSQARATLNKDELLPKGTYFYILNYEDRDGSWKQLSGHLYLN